MLFSIIYPPLYLQNVEFLFIALFYDIQQFYFKF